MFERFTADVRAAVMTHAPAEARQRGDRRVGTEHLLLGVLHDSEAARILGVDVDSARSALAALDEAALAAIGLDACGVERASTPAPSKRMPFTSGAKATLARALAVAKRTDARQITAAHLLAGLLDRDRTDPAADVFTMLGVDRPAIRARLAQ